MLSTNGYKQKLAIFAKLFVFNTFFAGFIANLVAYLNSSWIDAGAYTYGLFEYCRRVEGSISYVVLKLNNERKLVHELFSELQCLAWTQNRPS